MLPKYSKGVTNDVNKKIVFCNVSKKVLFANYTKLKEKLVNRNKYKTIKIYKGERKEYEKNIFQLYRSNSVTDSLHLFG